MEIPKIKILIYALTFLGYAWSGYGSGILLNLRDAVLAAEHFFGDFLGNVKDIIQKFKFLPEVLDPAIEEECIYSCPSGAEPVKNKYHKPSANGCGPEYLNLDIKKYIPIADLTACCDKHDICYSTCNRRKESCDLEFQRCLFKFCDNVPNNTSLMKACKAAAKLLFTSTQTLGCKSYLDSQKLACYCPENGKKRKYAATGNEL